MLVLLPVGGFVSMLMRALMISIALAAVTASGYRTNVIAVAILHRKSGN